MKSSLESNTIKLLTVHSSKGMEFKNVLLYSKSFLIDEPNYLRNPDERKVLYVGVTRAIDNLVILN